MTQQPTPDAAKAPQPQSEPGRPGTAEKSASWGLQIVQLVVIPAVIVVACVAIAVLFGRLAVARDTIDTHLLKLQQSSGAGRLALGLQDPRYKDRGLAAYNIATMIPGITDPKEKRRVGLALISILQENVSEDEHMLRSYLLLAIARLGYAGGLEVIIGHLTADHPRVLQGAIGALLSWPDRQEARQGLHELVALLQDPNATVRAAAAAALGQVARTEDQLVIDGLQQAMEESEGLPMREATWNAAVALARLGDPSGSRYVTQVLLNRQELSRMPAGESGPLSNKPMSARMQDRVMLSALASLGQTQDERIWDRIMQMADNDPSRSIRNAARQIVMRRRTGP